MKKLWMDSTTYLASLRNHLDSGQGKMPSPAELQMSIGDLGFEVIVVNHKFDSALQEMKEVAECCSLGCPDITVLVRRIAEVVAEHMGGPVVDANDMFTRWLGKSLEQRTSHQTSLLPIGRIEIGLSRHRALLFKILADSVGIPCKLVKGSHYTGVEDDAINIIKMDNKREFLVDVIAAPGTLIPADIFHSMGTSFNFSQTLGQNQVAELASNIEDGPTTSHSVSEKKGNQPHMFTNSNRIPDNQLGHENRTTARSSACKPRILAHQMQLDQTSTSAGSSSKQKENLKFTPDSQETEDPKKLFTKLDSFGAVESGRSSLAFKGLNNRNSELQRRRENVTPVSGRSQQPLVMKNWSTCNDISNKQYNFAEGLVSR